MEKSNIREIDIFESGRTIDKFAVVLALLLTLLIHIATICLIPSTFSGFEPFKKNETDKLKLEILPPKQKPRLPDFIEANPFANMEKPQRADVPESFQDQRAAEELPDVSSKSKKPFVAGEIKDGKKIVEGTSSAENVINPQTPFETLERPLERPAPLDKPEALHTSSSQTSSENAKDNTSAEKSENNESADNNALKDKEKLSEESMSSKDGEFLPSKPDKKTTTTDSTKQSKKSGESKDKNASAPPSSNDTTLVEQQKSPTTPKTDNSLPKPKPRPYLSMKIPAGPLADSNARASRQGRIAVDSRFSEFGAYQQRMIEAISRQWNLLGANYDLSTAVNTQIVIEFILDPRGDLVSLVVLYSNSTHTGRALCEQSILTTAPYGEWTRDMIATLGGQNQEVRITFHYR